MAGADEPDDGEDREGAPNNDAILIRWSDDGHWVYSLEDMDPLSAIGVLYVVITALAADAEKAVPWDGASEMES